MAAVYRVLFLHLLFTEVDFSRATYLGHSEFVMGPIMLLLSCVVAVAVLGVTIWFQYVRRDGRRKRKAAIVKRLLEDSPEFRPLE